MTDTSPPGTTPPGATAPETTGTRDPFGYPLRTKVAIVVVLTIAVAGFVFAGLTAETGTGNDVTVSGTPGETVSDSDGVEIRIPAEGSEILAQQPFGIDLEPGWTAELVLLPSNGPAIPIPEDEMTITSEINQFLYFPMQGNTIERLPGGTNCVRATIWNRVRGRAASERVESWCFGVA